MSAIAIIPARGGSRRIPRKNIKPFHGKPIIAYSIETARRSGLFDSVVVNTDDDEIADVAQNYKADVFLRSKEMGEDAVGTQDVARDFLMKSKPAEVACVIYATAPLMNVDDLVRGWNALHRNGAQFAFAVAEDPFGPAGYFYFGYVRSFVARIPLVAENSVMVPIPPKRCIDINTIYDWNKAEEMYAAIHG